MVIALSGEWSQSEVGQVEPGLVTGEDFLGHEQIFCIVRIDVCSSAFIYLAVGYSQAVLGAKVYPVG